MAVSAWHPSEDALDVVIRWLRDDVSASAPGSFHLLPGLANVRCTHLEDGWVHLTFMDWPLSAARAVADRLLHPDALQVNVPGGFPGVASPAFEGFGWDDEPPAAVLARHGRSPGPDGGPQPPLQVVAPTPTASTAPTPAVDWEDDLSWQRLVVGDTRGAR